MRAAVAVVPCASLVVITFLLGVLPNLFQHRIWTGARYTIIDFASYRLFFTTALYDFEYFDYISPQPQHNAVNPLGVAFAFPNYPSAVRASIAICGRTQSSGGHQSPAAKPSRILR